MRLTNWLTCWQRGDQTTDFEEQHLDLPQVDHNGCHYKQTNDISERLGDILQPGTSCSKAG